jgi:hypothetical protein
MFFMAWSPVRRTNAGRFEVDHPGDYATLNSYHPADGTYRNRGALSWLRELKAVVTGPGGYEAGIRFFANSTSQMNLDAQKHLSEVFGTGTIAFRDLYKGNEMIAAEKQRQRDAETAFQSWKKAQQEADDPAAGKSETDVLVAGAVAIMIEHEKCGGQISDSQKAAIQTQLAIHERLIASFSEIFKKGTCEDTSRAYNRLATEAARVLR